MHDNYIAYYKAPDDPVPQGCLHIDQKFQVTITGRVVTVSNRSRKLTFFAPTMKAAIEWAEGLNHFYEHTPKKLPQPFSGHFPPRPNAGVKLFCCGKEYFSALAVALLSAREEIFIASWMVSPTLLLTRPPLPPLRLDQILRFKAEQGVKIYVLLYKEVCRLTIDPSTLDSFPSPTAL
jgi:phosphatidylserine/phosphatidylglycerophosphate/cardiolipin synthase-like enzyme